MASGGIISAYKLITGLKEDLNARLFHLGEVCLATDEDFMYKATADGVGSVVLERTNEDGGNAAQLGGQLPAYYRNSTNQNAGTLADARLSSNVVLGSGGATTLKLKTLVTPTIASFINAPHTHLSPIGGGPISLTALSGGTLGTDITPTTDSTIDIGSATKRLATLAIIPDGLKVFNASGDANASLQLGASALKLGSGSGATLDLELRRSGVKAATLDDNAGGAADLTITGNLTVQGTTVSIESTVVDIKDRIVHVNHTAPGIGAAVPALITGLEIDRGDVVSAARDGVALVWVNDSSVVDPSTGTGYFRLCAQTGGDDSTLGADVPLHLTSPTISGFSNMQHNHTSSATGGVIDLTGYFLLAGRAGGQVAIFGTGASDPATITATSNATAGPVIFNGKPTLEYGRFIATGEFLVGRTTAISSDFQVQVEKTAAGGYAGIYVSNPHTTGFALIRIVDLATQLDMHCIGPTATHSYGTGTNNFVSTAVATNFRNVTSGAPFVFYHATTTEILRIDDTAVAGEYQIIFGDSTGVAAHLCKFRRDKNDTVLFDVVNANSGSAGPNFSNVGVVATSDVAIAVLQAVGSLSTGLGGSRVAKTAGLRVLGGDALIISMDGDKPIELWTGATPTEKVRLLATGELIVGATTLVGGEFVSFQKSLNSAVQVLTKNTNAGTAATTYLGVNNDNASAGAHLFTTSSGYTPAGVYVASMSQVTMSGAKAQVHLVGTLNEVYFAGTTNQITSTSYVACLTNSTTQCWRSLAGGQTLVGTITTLYDANALFVVQKDANAVCKAMVYNATSGTGAYTQLGSETASSQLSLLATSAAYTPAIGFLASDAILFANNAAAGLALYTYSATPIRVLTSQTERWRTLGTANTIQGNAGLTIQGGAGSGDDITISSTAHATKGSVNIGEATCLIGFYGISATVRPDAFTQTYSTATRTHSNLTTSDMDTTAATNVAPYGFVTAAQADAIATKFNQLVDDVENAKQVLNQVIDDLQLNGLLQ